jgi:eukaryotic-like serine/threonine-protein kinase
MSIDAELLLSPDVQIFPVRELAPQVRANVDAGDDDYAITRRKSRAPSRIIDKDSAKLLETFRKPMRIVDAVLAFAGHRGLEPEETLEQAYPLLHYLYQVKILEPADRASALRSELEPGDAVEGFRLIRCVQVLDDNEVFLARNAAARYAAVKFYRRPEERVIQSLEREAAMLRRAGTKRAPELYSLTHIGSGLALITEWILGVDATNAAAAIRRREARCEERLLSLCVDIATAFAEVHDSGVLHGDVHPRNVLVEGRGTVRLIDFGLAQLVEGDEDTGSRGGVAFYFDPQFAEAQRSHKPARLSAPGEQYSVASLLYQLWTGVYYVDWSLERDELLRQIVEESPMPFEARSVPEWQALEDILGRALEKRPERRFPSMRAFADALGALAPEASARDRKAALHHKERAREKELLDRMLRRYALGGEALRDGLAASPFASINYGAGGIAYAIYTLARRRGDPQLLALADVWSQKALALSSHEKAFYDGDLEITAESVGEVSLFHSISGLHCVRALIGIAMGDVNGANRAIQAFLARSRGPCAKPDLTLGSASLLLGCAELLEAMPAPWFIQLDPVRERGDEIAAELAVLLESGQMATSTRIPALGVAHGWAGFAFALLRWARATGKNAHPAVEAALDELAAMAEPHGSGVRWPVHNATSAPTFMEGWCNGTAGYAMLSALAHEVLSAGRFGEIAEGAALSAWAAETQVGTLCCGLGGIGYALLAAYRFTGSELWLERARAITRRAAADGSKYFLRNALYKGAVGVASLAEDLKEPQTAAMPLFEPTR